MRTKKLGKRQSGQALVEYALVLVLVAVVAIVALGLAGIAIQRNFGVIAAVLGAKKEETGVLTFNYSYLPQCGYNGSNTGLYAEIVSTIPIAELTVSTDTGFVTVLSPMGGNLYAINPQLASGYDPSVCPHGLMIQASQAYGGVTALYPVKNENWVNPGP